MYGREIVPEHVHGEIGVQVELEIELRHEIADRVEPEAAFDAGDTDVGPHTQRGAGLNRRRRDREVAVVGEAHDADVEARADTVERDRDIGRNLLEAWMEAACADEKGRLISELRAKR